MKSIFIALIATAFLCSACTNPDTAIRILTDDGYSEIQITGYVPFGCSEDDVYATGFTATNSNGKIVRGVVCSGLLKGSTIRLY
jgi:hypothetical protein